jgi:hypothetical protein
MAQIWTIFFAKNEILLRSANSYHKDDKKYVGFIFFYMYMYRAGEWTQYLCYFLKRRRMCDADNETYVSYIYHICWQRYVCYYICITYADNNKYVQSRPTLIFSFHIKAARKMTQQNLTKKANQARFYHSNLTVNSTLALKRYPRHPSDFC